MVETSTVSRGMSTRYKPCAALAVGRGGVAAIVGVDKDGGL